VSTAEAKYRLSLLPFQRKIHEQTPQTSYSHVQLGTGRHPLTHVCSGTSQTCSGPESWTAHHSHVYCIRHHSTWSVSRRWPQLGPTLLPTAPAKRQVTLCCGGQCWPASNSNTI